MPYGGQEEKGRERRIARLVAEMPLTSATNQAFREKRCIISPHQTNLYKTSGFSSSEFTGKISSLANLQLCVLHTSMTATFTSRESLCSMYGEKQICPSGI